MTVDRFKPLPLILGVAVLVVAACGQRVAGDAVAGDQVVRPSTAKASTRSSLPRPRLTSSSGVSSTAATPGQLSALAGTWVGEYTCGQGSTGLKLTIKDPVGGSLPTIFGFFPVAGNPAAKKGSYSMVGSLSASGQLVFKRERWIDQPPGYVMVDLAVTSPIEVNATQLSGDVLDSGCKGFSVRR